MKKDSSAIAEALVALASVVPEQNLAALCDKALELLSKDSSADMKAFVKEVMKALEKSGQVAFATLVTAKGGVSQARKDAIAAGLQKKLGKPVIVEEKVDPALLAGAQLRIGDDLYDASGYGDLQQLKLA